MRCRERSVSAVHDTMRENIRRTAAFFLLLLAILIPYVTYLQIFQCDFYYNHPLNQRSRNAFAVRGDIVDKDGEKLAYSQKSGNGYERFYPLSTLAAHAVGYADPKYGSGGVESVMQSYLSGSRNALRGLGAIAHLFREERGDTVRLTLSSRLQRAAGEAMAGRHGAVVALNPKTGAILAMVSFPAYDPNRIGEDWAALQEEEDAILLNRATQGLYPPGSILKTLIADAALTEKTATTELSIDCPGFLDVGEYRLPEIGDIAHGSVDLKEALTMSCNTYFGTMALKLGGAGLQKSFDRYGFGKTLADAGFYEAQSRIPDFSALGDGDIAQIGVGQGKLLVTPLRMAMVASVFANRGTLMKPHLIDKVLSPSNAVVKTYRAEKWLDVTTAENAAVILQAMRNAVENGTGEAAFIAGAHVAGKTGTAENEKSKPHAWFIGVAPAEDPVVAVAVIVENAGGGGRYAAPIARKILETSLSEEGNRW